MAGRSVASLSADEKLHIVQEGLRSENARRRVCEHRQIPVEVFNRWRERVVKAGKRALAQGEGAVRPDGRKFTSDEKVGVILQAMMDGTTVSDVCQRHRISTKQYERWRSAFLEAGEGALARPDWVMEGAKKVAGAVVLLVIIVAALWFGISRVAGKKPPPDWVLDREEDKIDAKSLETITKTLGEWNKLKGKHATWKNPETGDYTIRNILECRTCYEIIPQLAVPDDIPAEIVAKGEDATMQYWADYKCPRCGGPANPPLPRRPLE